MAFGFTLEKRHFSPDYWQAIGFIEGEAEARALARDLSRYQGSVVRVIRNGPTARAVVTFAAGRVSGGA